MYVAKMYSKKKCGHLDSFNVKVMFLLVEVYLVASV